MPWTAPQRAGATVSIWSGYSLAERDRRWKAAREAGASAGFDCLLVPLGNGIDGRYLTQLRCSAMVLPSDGRDPIVIADRSSRNEWVPDPWQTGREWAEPMGEALLDLRMERARIGVVGLERGGVTHVSSIDGVVNHTAFSEVLKKLPNAKFEDATDLVGFVRFVKSAEELAYVRRSAAVAAAGLDELTKLAKPDVDAAVLYASVIEKLLELRSEYFPLSLSIDPIDAARPRVYKNPPIGKRLVKNALITSEVNAILGAQLTQVCQPIVLGAVPDKYKPVIEAQREVYETGLSQLRDGNTFGNLTDVVHRLGRKHNLKAVAQLHGCGYGDDGPLLTANGLSEWVRNLRIEKGNAFVWKPTVITDDETIQFCWGGPVIVAANDAEPLFKRSHGVVSIDS
jgi:Xaa-Pro aminopeptidase